MARDTRPTDPLSVRPKAGVELQSTGEAGLINVVGLVDENFAGFGTISPALRTLVIDVSGMTRMTSFGVRQWLKAMDTLPKSLSATYLLSCPTFFVDQLNMVLNFGGVAKVLTVMAPYTCPSCGTESGETVDVLTERSTLAKSGVPDKECSRCGGKLEFDETPESYFSFVSKYGASSILPGAAQLLASLGLYTAVDVSSDKPPRVTKLVHGAVTYFRIVGTVGAMFRARPFLVGSEGEVVLDLAEVERFDVAGLREWKRLLKTLAGQVPAVSLVDVPESLLANAPDSLALARNIVTASVLLPYSCLDCGKALTTSHALENAQWPIQIPPKVCPMCGGAAACTLQPETLAPLQRASTAVPPASSKVINNRKELMSRAVADASVAQAGENASASLGADDSILGKYKIVRRLSAGGMAEVFLANQVGIGGFEKPVALKRILRQLLESRHLAVDMFLNEAKIAGRLTHPNIVQVLDVGEEKGALFLAMEYVRGKDLREVLKKLRVERSSMPLGDACFIIKEVAHALHHAYWSTDLAGTQLSVVHRDVSPHNVMVGFDGTVKLLDFGVAMSSVTDHAETMIAGKWAYMSPEHTTNQAVDHRSDLFSLGVMFYLLCTGNMPFTGTEPRELVKKIRASAYKPLGEVAPHLSPEIVTLVSSMLAPKPEDRPQTGQAIANTIHDIMRSHGLEGSNASISALVGRMFDGASDNTQGLRELVRVTGSQRIAVGSGPTDAQDPDRVSSTSGGSLTRLDVSVSLARRTSSGARPISESVPAAAPPVVATSPVVTKPPSGIAGARVLPMAPHSNRYSLARMLRVLLIAGLVVALAIVMYVFVRPT